MSPKDLLDKRISELNDWRGQLLDDLRKLILNADPTIKLEWKWGTAVWTINGNVCATGAFKDHVKLNFFKGAVLPDPDKQFNNGFTSKESRAVDFHKGDKINESALTELIRSAVACNQK